MGTGMGTRRGPPLTARRCPGSGRAAPPTPSLIGYFPRPSAGPGSLFLSIGREGCQSPSTRAGGATTSPALHPARPVQGPRRGRGWGPFSAAAYRGGGRGGGVSASPVSLPPRAACFIFNNNNYYYFFPRFRLKRSAGGELQLGLAALQGEAGAFFFFFFFIIIMK